MLEAGLQSLGVFSKSQKLPFRAGELQVYDSLTKTHFTYAIRNGDGYLLYFLSRSFKILATLNSLTLKEFTPEPISQSSPISNGKEVFLNGNSEKVGNISSLESSNGPVQPSLFIPFWSVLSPNESLANESKTEALIFSEPHRHQEIQAIKSKYPLSTFIPINDQYAFPQDKIEYSVDSPNLSDIFIFCPASANPIDGKNLRSYLSGFSELLQKIMAASPSLVSRKLRFIVFTFNGFVIEPNDQPSYGASVIRGFLSVLGKEIENWSVCVIDLSSYSDFDLEMVPSFNKGTRFIALRNGTVLEKKWHPFNWSEKNRGFKREGVYVIIGGAGGLGSSLTQYLINHYNASVIILGRRDKSQLSLDTIINDNLVSYIQADCTNKVALDEALLLIKQKYHKIDGVIHSPLTLQDHPIFNTTQDMIDKATLSKIDGTLNALDVFRQELLDFFLIFSSINSFLPQKGQASYSSACSFQDACQYMDYPCSIKIVNWGFWSEIGAVARQDFKDRFFKQGLFSINPAQAWEDIDHFLASDVSQIAYVPATEEYYQKAGTFELGDLSLALD